MGWALRHSGDHGSQLSAIIGVREPAAPTTPACLKTGRYEIVADRKTKWKQDGEPGGGGLGCKFYDRSSTEGHFRLSVLGADAYLDGDGPDLFNAPEVKRVGDCALSVSWERTDYHFDNAKIVFDGDRVSGLAEIAKWEQLEDGPEGGGIWSCTGTQVTLIGKRVGD